MEYYVSTSTPLFSDFIKLKAYVEYSATCTGSKYAEISFALRMKL